MGKRDREDRAMRDDHERRRAELRRGGREAYSKALKDHDSGRKRR